MKWDKAGASTVAGILKTLALGKMPVNVIGVLGLVENMPDGEVVLSPGTNHHCYQENRRGDGYGQ